MKRILLAASAIALCSAVPPTARASSHREAPAIAGLPRLDGTDLYMFRSYEPGRSAYMTMIADYIPFQDTFGGPNFFNLQENAVYDINIDNTGTAHPAFRFRFRFVNTINNITLPIGGTNVKVPFINVGAITPTDNSAQNAVETYTLSLVTGEGATEHETPITATDGTSVFTRPIDRIGNRSVPNYEAYARKFIYNINIPGCTTSARMFVGQRAEPFVVNLGETFDLLNYAHPIGEQYAASAENDLAQKNITSLIIEAPIACMVKGNDPIVAAWTTSSQVITEKSGKTTLRQVSRLANPLVNEVVIGLSDKDKFNGSMPINDPQFLTYVTNPTFPAVMGLFVGGTAPSTPRNDLVATFLTGIGPNPVFPAGLNMSPNFKNPGEEMRLNTSIAPTAAGSQNRLGVIGGDNAGYPNGRRPGDDVVDISLRVSMGDLITLGLYSGTAPSGALQYTDGAYVDSTQYGTSFPYLNTPHNGSPQK